MATSNQLDLSLSGQTGTGTFVGSTSPTITRPLIDNVLNGYTTTVTAAGTTTLTVASTYQQFFTGSTTQTVTMPVTSTLTIGQAWHIVNNSTGIVTLQSSGGNSILAMPGGTNSIITVIAQAGTTAADWNAEGTSGVAGVDSITGTANQVVASAPTGAVVLSLPQSIATTSAVTFGSLAFSSTSGVIGTTTNDNAAAGSVGEIVTSTVLAQAITSGVTTDLTSITLSAGDWDVYGAFRGIAAAGTTTSLIRGSISTTSVTHAAVYAQSVGYPASSDSGMSVPTIRLSLAGSTTVYLVGNITYAVSTLTYNAQLHARRAR